MNTHFTHSAISAIGNGIIYVFSTFVLLFCIFRIYFRTKKGNKDEITVGFFHPYANACGGGEKVLWAAIKVVEQIMKKKLNHKPIRCIIYTGDQESSEEILKKTRDVMHVEFESSFHIEFVRLRTRQYLEAKKYPHFTLLFQSLASIIVAFDALLQFTPTIFFDTTGHSFTYPIAHYLCDCIVLCYTHYPTISTDMLSLVRERKQSFNNQGSISNNPVMSHIKLLYYQMFSYLYGWTGRCVNQAFANSEWTMNHLKTIWRLGESKLFIIHPPCDTEELWASGKAVKAGEREKVILSVGQFRPEKNHELQLNVMEKILKTHSDVQLVMAGGCRNDADHQRVEDLRKKAQSLGIEKNVKFCVNVPYSELKHMLCTCLVGIHSMINEHFGICVVEYMAAGQVVVANNSAGPSEIVNPKYPISRLSDHKAKEIVRSVHPVGFLASTEEEYVDSIRFILDNMDQMPIIVENARNRAKDFSTDKFSSKLESVMLQYF